MKKTIFSTLFFLLLSGCTTVGRNFDEISNVHTAKLNATPAESIVVIADEQRGHLWYILGENHRLENLRFSSHSDNQNIIQLSVSPDDQWVAVLTVAEGHPIIDVYNLQQMIAGNQDEKNRLNVLQVDPYPGYIDIIGWEKDRLVISSDMPLERLNKQERKVTDEDITPLSEERIFHWHLLEDNITHH